MFLLAFLQFVFVNFPVVFPSLTAGRVISAEMFQSFPTGLRHAGHWKMWFLPPELLNRRDKNTNCSTMSFMLPRRNEPLKWCQKYSSKAAKNSALGAAIPSTGFPLLLCPDVRLILQSKCWLVYALIRMQGEEKCIKMHKHTLKMPLEVSGNHFVLQHWQVSPISSIFIVGMTWRRLKVIHLCSSSKNLHPLLWRHATPWSWHH